MDEFKKILKLTQDSKLDLAEGFKNAIHKELCLGQTRYMCRYGTLSEGHEKITDAQKYYQAIKEMWTLRCNMMNMKCSAMEANADLLEAEEALEKADTDAKKLRAEAKILRSKETITYCLTVVEDQMRMLDEYNNVRLELKPIVDAKYPGGIEESEEDSWKAVLALRLWKEPVIGVQNLFNVPLPHEMKAKIGEALGRPDLFASQAALHPQTFGLLANARSAQWQKTTSFTSEQQTPELTQGSHLPS